MFCAPAVSTAQSESNAPSKVTNGFFMVSSPEPMVGATIRAGWLIAHAKKDVYVIFQIEWTVEYRSYHYPRRS
jgi:hypothetical protein